MSFEVSVPRHRHGSPDTAYEMVWPYVAVARASRSVHDEQVGQREAVLVPQTCIAMRRDESKGTRGPMTEWATHLHSQLVDRSPEVAVLQRSEGVEQRCCIEIKTSQEG
jgi:hypothetical protein